MSEIDSDPSMIEMRQIWGFFSSKEHDGRIFLDTISVAFFVAQISFLQFFAEISNSAYFWKSSKSSIICLALWRGFNKVALLLQKYSSRIQDYQNYSQLKRFASKAPSIGMDILAIVSEQQHRRSRSQKSHNQAWYL